MILFRLLEYYASLVLVRTQTSWTITLLLYFCHCTSYSIYFRAETLALTIKSSAPLPGIHCLITSRDSSLISMQMDSGRNPAASSWLWRVSISGAPDTQQAIASIVFKCAGNTAFARVTTSQMATRPPFGFSTRYTSRST